MLLSVLAAVPASAATVYGSFGNSVTGKAGGQYTYIDCNGCPAGDDSLSVSNWKDGYGIRAYFRAEIGGEWQLYIKKYAGDNTSAKWFTGAPPNGVKVWIQICNTNSAGTNVGVCHNHYTVNSM